MLFGILSMASHTTIDENNILTVQENNNFVGVFVVKKFSANETGSYGTRGSTTKYIESINLKTGEKLFSKKIKSKNNDIKLLLINNRKIFALVNGEINIFDLETGIQEQNKIKISDNISFINSDDSYKINEQTKEITILASDGISYLIDTNSLEISEINEFMVSNDDENDLSNNIKSSIFYERGLKIANYGDEFLLLLSDKDISDLKNDIELDRFSNMGNRFYLYKGLLEEPENLKKLHNDVFILGAFITLETAKEKLSFDPKNESFDDYIHMLGRGNQESIQPLSIQQDIYFILHKNSIERSDNYLISSFDLENGKILWTTALNFNGIGDIRLVDRKGIFIIGNVDRDSNSNYSYLDLETGRIINYNFKYGLSASIR